MQSDTGKARASRSLRDDRDRDELVADLVERSRQVRLSILDMIEAAQQGHIGGDLSVTDILVTLYGGTLRVDPSNSQWPERDRLVLSKGHCAGALYATLAHHGFLPVEDLLSFMQPHSALNGHPDRTKVPGVETNTGPLGHGLPVGVGIALGAKISGADYRTVVVLGDGELQEGSNWEAAMTASHYRLGSLAAIVDRNRFQQGAATEETMRLEPLAERWQSFGWQVREVCGHDHAALLEALEPGDPERPMCIVANTVKGRGVSFAEDRAEWHHKVPTPDQFAAARQELSA